MSAEPVDTAADLPGEEVARQRFGWESLRPGQAEAATALVAGRDTLVVMPTGHGKSAVYQLAALQVPSATVVVSPLIALQHDQVAGLAGTGLELGLELGAKLVRLDAGCGLDGVLQRPVALRGAAREPVEGQRVVAGLVKADDLPIFLAEIV